MFNVALAQSSGVRVSDAPAYPLVGPKTYLDAAKSALVKSARMPVAGGATQPMAAPTSQIRLGDTANVPKQGFHTKAELEAAMSKGSATCKWDVVTSYSLEKLNSILAQSHDAGKSPKKVCFDLAVGAPALGIPERNHHVTLDLGYPTLQFQADSKPASCELSIPISSGSIECNADETLSQMVSPNAYTIKITAPLASVSGKHGKVSEQGEIITVNEYDSDHKIFLDFSRDDRTTFKVVSQSGETLPADDVFGHENQRLLADALRHHFTDTCDDILYELGSISQYKGAKGDMLLRPEQFVLVTQSDGEDAVLSVYINVSGTDNPSGEDHPSFKPGGSAILPIPQGSDASIIFSRDAMSRMLAAALQSNTDAVTSAGIFMPHTTTGHAGVKLVPQPDKVELSYQHKSGGKGRWVQHDKVSVNNFTVDYNQHPLRLSFDENKVNALQLDWSVQQQHVGWKYERWVTGAKVDNDKGDLEFDCSAKKTVALNFSDNKLSLDASLQRGDYQASFKRGKGNWGDFSNPGRSIPGRLLDQLTSAPNWKSSCLTMPAIDFTQEKNVLLDGNHTFSIDTAAGLTAPWDYLLVGNIYSQ